MLHIFKLEIHIPQVPQKGAIQSKRGKRGKVIFVVSQSEKMRIISRICLTLCHKKQWGERQQFQPRLARTEMKASENPGKKKETHKHVYQKPLQCFHYPDLKLHNVSINGSLIRWVPFQQPSPSLTDLFKWIPIVNHLGFWVILSKTKIPMKDCIEPKTWIKLWI